MLRTVRARPERGGPRCEAAGGRRRRKRASGAWRRRRGTQWFTAAAGRVGAPSDICCRHAKCSLDARRVLTTKPRVGRPRPATIDSPRVAAARRSQCGARSRTVWNAGLAQLPPLGTALRCFPALHHRRIGRRAGRRSACQAGGSCSCSSQQPDQACEMPSAIAGSVSRMPS